MGGSFGWFATVGLAGGGLRRRVPEAPALIAGLDDVAVMGESVQ
ncbi:GlyGly-CTERM sorting domain-containing protein [Aquabacterium sp.]